MEKDKVFIIPEAIVVQFKAEDIIVTSGDVGDWWGGQEGDEWWDGE